MECLDVAMSERSTGGVKVAFWFQDPPGATELCVHVLYLVLPDLSDLNLVIYLSIYLYPSD